MESKCSNISLCTTEAQLRTTTHDTCCLASQSYFIIMSIICMTLLHSCLVIQVVIMLSTCHLTDGTIRRCSLITVDHRIHCHHIFHFQEGEKRSTMEELGLSWSFTHKFPSNLKASSLLSCFCSTGGRIAENTGRDGACLTWLVPLDSLYPLLSWLSFLFTLFLLLQQLELQQTLEDLGLSWRWTTYYFVL